MIMLCCLLIRWQETNLGCAELTNPFARTDIGTSHTIYAIALRDRAMAYMSRN